MIFQSGKSKSILKLPRGLTAKPGQRYCIHIDLALRHDSAGIAMAHAEEGRVIVDYVEAIKAEDFPDNDNEIDYAAIRQFIVGLRDQGFNIARVTFDTYQSADSIQQLKQKGFKADTLSVDRNTEAYDLLKELIYTECCALPNHPLLIQELCQLELIRGKKIDHPPRGSKDVADAVAGAVYNVYTTAMLGTPTFVFDGEVTKTPQGQERVPAGVHIVEEGVISGGPIDVDKIAAERFRDARGRRLPGWN